MSDRHTPSNQWTPVTQEMPPQGESVLMRRTGSEQIPEWEWKRAQFVRSPDETPDVELRALREHIAWAWSIIASAGGGDWNKESADWREAAGKWERARNPYDGLEGSSPKTSGNVAESHIVKQEPLT